MNKTIGFALGALLVGSFAQPRAVATVIHVGPAGNHTQIQAGIDAAQKGDTVLVAPGLYAESISFLGKAITVTSEQGAAVTTIQGQGSSTVSFSNREGTESVLEGFTITGGSGTSSGERSWAVGSSATAARPPCRIASFKATRPTRAGACS